MAPWSRPEPERLPDLTVAALIAVRAIDESSPLADAQLVQAFLWAAWPTLQAQNQ